MSNEQTKRPSNQISKYFNSNVATGKFNVDWACTIHNYSTNDENTLKRLSEEAKCCYISRRTNRKGIRSIRGYFQYEYTKNVFILQRELEMRGTWGLPLLDTKGMERWATHGDIIVTKHPPNRKMGKSKGDKSKKPPKSIQPSPAPIIQASMNQTPMNQTPTSTIDTLINKLKSRPTPTTLTKTQNYYVYGENSDEVAMKIAELLHEKFYIKDNSLYWDDYDDEKVVVIPGVSAANAKKFSQLYLWMSKNPSKVPCRLWPIWINPVSIIVAACDTVDVVFNSFSGISPLLHGKMEIIDAQKMSLNDLNIKPLTDPHGDSNYLENVPDPLKSRLRERSRSHSRDRHVSRGRRSSRGRGRSRSRSRSRSRKNRTRSRSYGRKSSYRSDGDRSRRSRSRHDKRTDYYNSRYGGADYGWN
ncbi:Uncharacterized protein QTN25_005029 [Entamoeba marina]